jgi:hypothetical protein
MLQSRRLMETYMQTPQYHLPTLYCVLALVMLAATACTRPTMTVDPVAVVTPPHATPPVVMPPSMTPPVVGSTAHAPFGSRQVFHVGHSVTYADGLVVVLDIINDSRCKPNVQCIWAGELAPQLTVRGSKIGASQTVSLGTQRNTKRMIAGYELALLDASTDAATLMVTNGTDVASGVPAPAKGDSGVHGVVLIGPTCPVERMPPDPNCRDKPYTATFSIDTMAGVHVATVASAADGSLAIGLRPGAYVIRLQSNAVMPRMAPQEFSVAAHAQTQLRLNLDSGMR